MLHNEIHPHLEKGEGLVDLSVRVLTQHAQSPGSRHNTHRAKSKQRLKRHISNNIYFVRNKKTKRKCTGGRAAMQTSVLHRSGGAGERSAEDLDSFPALSWLLTAVLMFSSRGLMPSCGSTGMAHTHTCRQNTVYIQ